MVHKIAVVGLGYVGLPLAVEFGRKFTTVGFDTDETRIEELALGFDRTKDCSEHDINSSQNLTFSSETKELSDCDIFIIAVPTPINEDKSPNLNHLIAACKTIGPLISRGDTIIFESTVYPGATEEVCVPELELASGLEFNVDFFCGYSPERINPGDRNHRIGDIVKVTSGSSIETAAKVDELYKQIIHAGTFRASSIKVAEAAKVIENTQRDLNIALMNELAVIFSKLGISTSEVLEAAETKWNFLPFKPGLVGGHCIGVDPYYLTFKARDVGHNSEFILAGREVNNSMAKHVALRFEKLLSDNNVKISGAKVLVLGLTFKENCPDIRNTMVLHLVEELCLFGIDVDVYDPWVDNDSIPQQNGINLLSYPEENFYDGIILAVAHNEFVTMPLNQIRAFGKNGGLIFDVKSVLDKSQVDGSL